MPAVSLFMIKKIPSHKKTAQMSGFFRVIAAV